MARKLTEDEQKAKEIYAAAEKEYYAAGDKLGEAFDGYWKYLDKDDFEGAREFLRPMPDSVEKVLMFRNIIGKENGEDIRRKE